MLVIVLQVVITHVFDMYMMIKISKLINLPLSEFETVAFLAELERATD